jgi:hypothetical protein
MFRDIKGFAVISVILYTLAYYAWILFFNGSQTHRIIISDILQTIPPILVFIILLKTSLKARNYKDKLWMLLTIGCEATLLPS